MANERDDEQFGKQDTDKAFGETKQQPAGEQGQKPEFGQQGQQGESGQQGQNPSGQADFATDRDTDTPSTEKDFGGSQATGETGGAGVGTQGGGFVGSQGSGSSDYLREDAAATPDFAAEGQGATENSTLENPDEDIETGQIRRDNDVAGGTGA